jgi:hypothetical protein
LLSTKAAMGRRKRYGKNSPQKNISIQVSEGNEDNRYKVSDSNK